MCVKHVNKEYHCIKLKQFYKVFFIDQTFTPFFFLKYLLNISSETNH